LSALHDARVSNLVYVKHISNSSN